MSRAGARAGGAEQPAPPALTDLLCTRCGLCCDGTLFADVQLGSPAEVNRVELLGLALDEDGERPVLAQPCTGLRGRRCSVYAHRPRCCRTFECALLRRARAGAVSPGRAARAIAATHVMIRRLERRLGPRRLGTRKLALRERCSDALALRPADAALRRAVRSLERRLERIFLA